MKKSGVFKLFLIATGVSALSLILSCEKKTSASNRFIGTWISTDLVDTIKFQTEHDLYKNVGIPNDHFNYNVSGDSITIQYNGVLYVLVEPTVHYYKFIGDTLTIDLERCYGFRNQVISFTRK